MDDWISLNVGGRLFECSRGTLISDTNSALARMFDKESGLSPARTADGVFCLDADPDCFKVILTSTGSSSNFISHCKSTLSRG